MHIRFGATETRDIPAKDDRAASVMTVQKGWIIDAGTNGEPDTSVPFQVTVGRGQEPYAIGPRYRLTAAHLQVAKFGRIEFNPYAPFVLEEAQTPDARLSALAAASGPGKAA